MGLMPLQWETRKGCGCWLLVKDVCLPLKAHSEHAHYFRALSWLEQGAIFRGPLLQHF